MPYSQILTLIIALLVIAGAPEQPKPNFSFLELAIYFLAILLTWIFISKIFISTAKNIISLQKRIKRLEISSLFLLFIDFYILNLKTYLFHLHFVKIFSSFIDIVGLAIYCLYLIVVWIVSWSQYRRFNIDIGTRKQFVLDEFRIILPAIVPYILISLLLDFILLLPISWQNSFINKPIGEIISFSLFLLLIIFLLPPIVKWLWGCKRLPNGIVRQKIEDFFKKQNISFSEILIWPFAGGRICTAAVLGIAPCTRYILLTPCIIENFTQEEIEAILSHEIAHIYYKHLLIYFFFIAAYAFVLYRAFDPLWIWFLSQPFSIDILLKIQDTPQTLSSFLTVVPLMFLILTYFRYLMGYFMRNFERQADLFCFRVQGHPWHMISALKKVAWLSGIPEEQPSWHHFSIKERIDFLVKCSNNIYLIHKHTKKILTSITIFLLCCILLSSLPNFLPIKNWRTNANINLVELYLKQLSNKGKQEPEFYIALAQLLVQAGRYKQAEKVYEKALKIFPTNPDIMNNLAWLLATSDNSTLLQKKKALLLALKATKLKPKGYILDTLAQCFYVNGFYKKAIAVELKAIKIDPYNKSYYQRQLKKFLLALNNKNKTQ